MSDVQRVGPFDLKPAYTDKLEQPLMKTYFTRQVASTEGDLAEVTKQLVLSPAALLRGCTYV